MNKAAAVLVRHSNTIKSRLFEISLKMKESIPHNFLQLFSMFCWIALLYYTDSYYIIYLAIALLGFCCRCMLTSSETEFFSKVIDADLIVASSFSLMIMLANYNIPYRMLQNIISTYNGASFIQNNIDRCSFLLSLIVYPLLIIGGTCTFYFLLRYLSKKLTSLTLRHESFRLKPHWFFTSVFVGLCAFYSSIMLLCFYPGITTTDSCRQISEILSGNYSNHHPFFHTLSIRFFMAIGHVFSDNINIGVLLYSLASILFLSAVFSYMITTLYQLKIHKAIIISLIFFYFLLPSHIMNSFTMWKDIPFSAVVLLFTVSFFRVMKNIGKHHTDDRILLFLSVFCFCLLRNNGLIAFIIVIFAFAIIYRKYVSQINIKRLLIGMSSSVVLCIIIVNPVMDAMGIKKTETVESFSIPIQQISRTVIDNNDLSEKQEKLISELIDVEKIRELYSPYISDPVKFYISDHGNQQYFNEHKMKYVLLYFQLGLSHPGSYMTAWIDQTKGYWNAGYDYPRFSTVCDGEDLGIKRVVVNEKLQRVVLSYFSLFNYFDILKPFQSIGLFTWLTLLVSYIGFKKKDKLTLFLTVPCVAIILTLLIATPVFAEFRYAYSLFCCLPFLGAIALVNDNDMSDLEVN